MRARPGRPQIETVERRSSKISEAIEGASAAPTPNNLVLAGDEYFAIGVLDHALVYYEQAARLEPANAAASDGMARVWRDWRFPQLALPHAARAVFHAPGSAAAHNTLGTIFQALRMARDARREFDRALSLDSGAAYALNNLCYSWLSEGNSEDAGTACRSALALDPRLTPARNNLALAYAVGGDFAGASTAFAGASPAAREFNLGIVLLAQRRFHSAAAAFDRAAAMEPAMPLVSERARQARRLADTLVEDSDARR